MLEFRNLKPEEIYVRASQVTKNGATFLLYKDARCDMDILDETVGSENWQRRHAQNKGNLFCEVGINVNHDVPSAAPSWVWKQCPFAENITQRRTQSVKKPLRINITSTAASSWTRHCAASTD